MKIILLALQIAISSAAVDAVSPESIDPRLNYAASFPGARLLSYTDCTPSGGCMSQLYLQQLEMSDDVVLCTAKIEGAKETYIVESIKWYSDSAVSIADVEYMDRSATRRKLKVHVQNDCKYLLSYPPLEG